MKGLILSFFAALLVYSLFFDENEDSTTGAVLKENNSVLMIQPASIWANDTLQIDKTYTMISFTDVLNAQHIL